MSVYRHQALIKGPLEKVWELVGDPRRHPEWWPRVIEVDGERFEQDATYRQVTKAPVGTHQTTLVVERLDDMKGIRTRCLDTGMYADWHLTGAQDDTFLQAEMGIDPKGLANRVFDAAAGSLYFRRWLRKSIDGLQVAVRSR